MMAITCKQCGASLTERDAFCTKCGAQRADKPRVASPQTHCTKCGSELPAQTKFCTKCGAVAGTPPSSSATSGGTLGGSIAANQANATVTHASAPVAESSGRIFKIAAVLIALVVVLVLAIAGGSAYLAHRAKKKVTEIERTYAKNPLAAAAGAARAIASAGANKDSAATPPKVATAAAAAAPSSPSSAIPVNPTPPPPPKPVPATGDQAKDWAVEYERTPGGPEADLVARTGDINNLGFGWPQGFDPFSGQSTPMHPYPWTPPAGAADGTDRIMLGSGVDPTDSKHSSIPSDGYSSILNPCERSLAGGPPCKERVNSMPRPIVLVVGDLPPKVDAVLFQVFVDDFQAPVFHSHFQVSLNGTRIPSFEDSVNSLNQTGPVGKLITLRLLPEYWPLLHSGSVNFLVDDPTTHARDGYAIDFVRILVNPHNFKYQVSLAASVVDADNHAPIAGANVAAALVTATTDAHGHCSLKGLPAGLVIASANAAGYDENSAPADLVAGQAGSVEIPLHRHAENTAALERALAQTGTATIYGIHFDTNSAKLRPDSAPALNAVLGLINSQPSSHWIIAGHTDNQGSAALNQPLSEKRAASVVAWLQAHGVAVTLLAPQGFGASRPVADNGTANGRALNRRVEISLGIKQ